MSAPSEPTLSERLDAVRASAERDAYRSPDAARAVLDARARRLARPIAPDGSTGTDVMDILLFHVGDEQLGIPLGNIVAVARVGGIARLPRAVLPVYGVTPWRGRPLTVLTLSQAQPPVTPDTRLVILGSGARAALAVVADGVDDIRRIWLGDLTPAHTGPRRQYTLGVASDGLLVVSGDALLHPESLNA